MIEKGSSKRWDRWLQASSVELHLDASRVREASLSKDITNSARKISQTSNREKIIFGTVNEWQLRVELQDFDEN